MRARQRGFTLIEVATVAGLGLVLAGLALPSLQQHLVKSRRADGTAALTHLQLAQEQHLDTHGGYAPTLTALRGMAAARSPDGLYTIELQARPDGYVASAQATGQQASDRRCATLTLTVELGFASVGPTPDCWGH